MESWIWNNPNQVAMNSQTPLQDNDIPVVHPTITDEINIILYYVIDVYVCMYVCMYVCINK